MIDSESSLSQRAEALHVGQQNGSVQQHETVQPKDVPANRNREEMKAAEELQKQMVLNCLSSNQSMFG